VGHADAVEDRLGALLVEREVGEDDVRADPRDLLLALAGLLREGGAGDEEERDERYASRSHDSAGLHLLEDLTKLGRPGGVRLELERALGVRGAALVSEPEAGDAARRPRLRARGLRLDDVRAVLDGARGVAERHAHERELDPGLERSLVELERAREVGLRGLELALRPAHPAALKPGLRVARVELERVREGLERAR